MYMEEGEVEKGNGNVRTPLLVLLAWALLLAAWVMGNAPSAACQNTVDPRSPPTTLATAVGNYQLLPYLLPAAELNAAGSPPAALRMARAAQALAVLALLAVALFALYDAVSPLVSLLGLLLAVTPMVLFCGASLSGSGMEIAGAVAFFSCLLRVARPDAPPARWWFLTALSGATLALSRSASPAWLVLALLAAVGWSGPGAFASRWRSDRAPRIVLGVLAWRSSSTGFGKRYMGRGCRLTRATCTKAWWRVCTNGGVRSRMWSVSLAT